MVEGCPDVFPDVLFHENFWDSDCVPGLVHDPLSGEGGRVRGVRSRDVDGVVGPYPNKTSLEVGLPRVPWTSVNR